MHYDYTCHLSISKTKECVKIKIEETYDQLKQMNTSEQKVSSNKLANSGSESEKIERQRKKDGEGKVWLDWIETKINKAKEVKKMKSL